MPSTRPQQAVTRSRVPARSAGEPSATQARADAVAMRPLPAAAVCPVSRHAISAHGSTEDRACLVTLNDARGWQPGNLAVLGARALRAKAALGVHEALARAEAAQASAAAGACGSTLRAEEWRRLAVLMSFATPLPHTVAATLPLAVLPPSGVQPLNPIQALQCLLTRELGRSDGCARVRLMGRAFGDTPLAHDYYRFAAALLPRLIEARRLADPLLTRQACEDAWLQPLVQTLWRRLALQLDLRRSRALLRHALRHGIGASGAMPVQLARPHARRPARAPMKAPPTQSDGPPLRLRRSAQRRAAAIAPAPSARPVGKPSNQANTATT